MPPLHFPIFCFGLTEIYKYAVISLASIPSQILHHILELANLLLDQLVHLANSDMTQAHFFVKLSVPLKPRELLFSGYEL